MFTATFNGLVSLLGNAAPRTNREREMLTYAKTEYGNDWQYAYQYMIDHSGSAPKMGVHI